MINMMLGNVKLDNIEKTLQKCNGNELLSVSEMINKIFRKEIKKHISEEKWKKS